MEICNYLHSPGEDFGGEDINGRKLDRSELDQCNDWLLNKETGQQINIVNPYSLTTRNICDLEPAHIICIAIEASTAGICGDNYVDPEEECDDGNSINGDGCSELCLIEDIIPPWPPPEPPSNEF